MTIGMFALWDGEPERAASTLRGRPSIPSSRPAIATRRSWAASRSSPRRSSRSTASPRPQEVLAPFEAAARHLDRPSALAAGHRVRGLLATAAGDEAAASAAFAAAIAQHARLAEPFERG